MASKIALFIHVPAQLVTSGIARSYITRAYIILLKFNSVNVDNCSVDALCAYDVRASVSRLFRDKILCFLCVYTVLHPSVALALSFRTALEMSE